MNDHPSADIIPGTRMVVNIKVKTWPLIVKIHYNAIISYISFISARSEDDEIGAETI